uniref:LOW QUALITY PROTEIN: MOB-like protein phocein n=1 Tax=Styela clava TaxID=7725 RepID=UPI0019395E89|nr:LOW QUALITY PROTEIN: MOB-like protein phocein [Styela clava]
MVMKETEMSFGQILRRNPPGTKSADLYNWPDQSFDEMDTTLAVQQYIQQTIRKDYSDIDQILSAPEGQDEGVWKYEHLRQFCLELNGLAVKLQTECTAETCSQMTATEQWIFLCAAHKTPKECPAIDNTRHTLDGAACLLNSNKYFPSRVSIKESSVAKLGSVCRRVYRIFSHAYYHHRHIFDEFENESHLCRRFTVFVVKYNLMSRDNLIVPILPDPEDPSPKETSPTYTLVSSQVENEDGQPADDSPLDETPATDDTLSTTIIQAATAEQSEDEPKITQEEGFGHSGGTADFATLKLSKSSDKKDSTKSVNANNSNNLVSKFKKSTIL